jgi:uncharacterized protein
LKKNFPKIPVYQSNTRGFSEIPKIMLCGGFSSGKTTFIRSVSDTEFDVMEVYSESRQNPVALDKGSIFINNNQVVWLFANPGARRFEMSLDMLYENCIGYILVVDSSKPETFREAKAHFDLVHFGVSTPLVIAANKQDLSDAWSVEDLRIVLRIPPEIPIIPCVATDKKSVANVLIALCEEVLQEMDVDGAEA